MLFIKVALPNPSRFPHLTYKKVWANSRILEFLKECDTYCTGTYDASKSNRDMLIFNIKVENMSLITFTKMQLFLKDEEILEVTGRMDDDRI